MPDSLKFFRSLKIYSNILNVFYTFWSSFSACFSFHPQIKWFQEEESVTVKIKLTSPMMQKCEFFSDKVLYRSVHTLNLILVLVLKKYLINKELQYCLLLLLLLCRGVEFR